MMLDEKSPDPWLVLVIFVIAIFGLATAIAVLKFGQFFFGFGHCPIKDCKAEGHPRELRRFLGRIPYVGDLFYCPPCLAFWIGMAISLGIVSPSRFIIHSAWQAAIIDGLLASGATWLLHLIAERLGHNLDL